ncbi:hypothetical protein ACFX2J_000334 [Malus domestica]
MEQTYAASCMENQANFVDVEKMMKALQNSSVTTLKSQIPIFGYGNISTITPSGQPIELTSTRTLTDVFDTSTSLPHDGQIVRRVATAKMQALQNQGPSSDTKAHLMQP